ncbi:MAG TPA: DNA-binding response regulator [Bacteroidetes bacterium]|nr:DNA-binding response regulator [Bacteroidota bacterium]
MEQIKIFVADDHQLFIEGIKALIRDSAEVKLIGEAENGEDLLNQLKNVQPEVILMDINMPKLSGIEATKKIRQQFPEIKILALTMFDDSLYVSEMIKAGASGYLLKNAGKAELINAITKVNKGERYVSSEVSLKLIEQMNSPVEHAMPPVRKAEITKRELEIVRLIAQELTNAEIAVKLNNSPMTIITHRKNILRKLGVKNTAGLIKYAMESGMLRDDYVIAKRGE